jgi:hypothetical protein
VAELRGWLERQQRWLLVLDNVDDPQHVVDLLPRSTTGQVVITSRTGVGWERLASVLRVDVLAPADAAGLLLTRTEETGPGAEAAAASLTGTLGGLPLALEQAGAYVASTGTITLASYAALFATRALELLSREQPLGYQHTVATTWSLALQRLRETLPGAVDLLVLASFLGPDDLPLPLLAGQSQELPEPLASTADDPLALADAVTALRRYSLIRVVADGLYVHRLVQAVVRADLDVEDAQTWAATAVRLLRAGFPASEETANWPEYERLLQHVLVAVNHAQRLGVESQALQWLQINLWMLLTELYLLHELRKRMPPIRNLQKDSDGHGVRKRDILMRLDTAQWVRISVQRGDHNSSFAERASLSGPAQESGSAASPTRDSV